MLRVVSQNGHGRKEGRKEEGEKEKERKKGPEINYFKRGGVLTISYMHSFSAGEKKKILRYKLTQREYFYKGNN